MPDVEALVPAAPLAAFLDEALPETQARPASEATQGDDLAITKIGEGRSNLTFRVERGSNRWILRRPPLGDIPETAHDMLREHRVLSALAGTSVRVPSPVAVCPDPAVLGVPFYLMDEVDGVVIRDQLPPSYTQDDRAAIGVEMIDALAELHTVDPAAVGLDDLGKPQGYTARQVTRWTKQLQVMATRELPDIDAVRGWLDANQPSGAPTGIVHGDYKLDNVVFSAEGPARLRAILDWEMATLGDPLADLGYLMLFWPEPGEENIGGLPQPTQQPGFFSRAQLMERYTERTGLELHDLDFYRTLALWKLAILLEGLYKRFKAGKADSDWFAVLEHVVPQMAATARSWCGA